MIHNEVVFDRHYSFNRFTVRNNVLLCFNRFTLRMHVYILTGSYCLRNI